MKIFVHECNHVKKFLLRGLIFIFAMFEMLYVQYSCKFDISGIV